MSRKKTPNENAKKALTQAKKDARKAKAYAARQRKDAQLAAKEKAKEIRKYSSKIKNIDLRKNLTTNELRYINKAFAEYTNLTSRPFKVYKPKTKSKLKTAQSFARHNKGAPKFDVAFIPTIDPKSTKIRVKGNEVTVRSKYLTQRSVLFDMMKLASDPNTEIQRALAEYPNADSFIIMAGEYQFNGGLTRDLVQDKVLQMMMRYSPGGSGYEKRGENSHFKNWLFGLEAYFYKNQDDFDNYRIAFQREREKQLKERRGERNRFKRKYGNRINVFKK